MPFAAADEALHPPNGHAFWNESYYFNFFDDAGWAGATRIGFSPGRGYADGFLCLYFPDGSAGFVRSWRPWAAVEAVDTGSRIAAPPFHFEMLAPFGRWRVSYEGPIFHFEDPREMADLARTHLAAVPTRNAALELEFDALHAPYDFHASGTRRLLRPRALASKLRPGHLLRHARDGARAIRSLPAMAGASHYEQACRFRGEIRVGGERHALRGTGQRDHSWGVRDMRVPKSWRWFSCQFGETLAFNATRVEVLGLEVLGGYVFNGKESRGLRDLHLEVQEWSDDGRYAERARLVIDVDEGETLTFDIEALTNLPVVVETHGHLTRVDEARARFTCLELGESHIGISEFMGQLGP